MQQPYSDQTVTVLEEAERLKLNCCHEEAITMLEDLLSSDPANVAALEEIADNYLSLEKYEQAVNAAKQAVALDQESYMGHYILGFAASLKEDWELACKELKLANNINPNNSEILRCLGWALFHKEDRVQGIVTIERSVNIDPDNALSLCDLGVCYLQVQNFKKATTLFVKVLEMEPENERARECVDMVKRIRAKKTKE